MSNVARPHYGGDPMILENPPGIGILRAAGPTVPSDGAAGYATGCIFQHTDGGAGTALYVNEGSITSADFDAASVA